MITFIYGNDNFRVKNATQAEISRLKNLDSQNVLMIITNEDEDPVALFKNHLNRDNLFGGATIIAIQDALFKKETVQEFESLLTVDRMANQPEMNIVISESMPAKELNLISKNLFGYLSGHSRIIDCPTLTEGELWRWVVGQAKERGLTLGLPLARELIVLVGNDSQALTNEVDKLANFCRQKEVSRQDIQRLATGLPEFNVFDLVDAVAARDKNRAFQLVYVSLKLNNDPVQLLRPIIYQFRNLLMVKDYTIRHGSGKGIEKSISLHPFVMKKTINQAKLFELTNLKNLYSYLAEIDVGIKSGAISPETAFDQFILRL